jgi:CubicO group peptidase (beta-lactamase class C family)
MPEERRQEVDWEDVRELLAALPGVEYQPPAGTGTSASSSGAP